INRLDKSSKLDEIDTVAFGLETDDKKIVKVYVNVEQATDFEKALSDMLGEVDDIEQVLNDLAKEYEIVDVEWPDEEPEEDAEPSEDDLETDGSEAMNQNVWKNKNNNDPVRAKVEEDLSELNLGERFTMELNEGTEGNSIESRLTTATQMMLYH